ncbi:MULTISPECIES: hypothetical protein [unclassified Streptomyces]|nr:hypothetical protein [Streptomyces sp. NBC_01571]MCX4577404.1 hypothetical protein [Streptomyces sp. NBC_01571]WSS84441.1 hypothetical protein OG199_15905 [Streptomyces sp. NBC_01176]
MNSFMDNLVGMLPVLAVLAALAVVALPSLIGLAHERRVDRQIRASSLAR